MAELFNWLPTDLFFHLIKIGVIRGKNLVSLALVCKTLRQKCNARKGALYKQLLMLEHGDDILKNHVVLDTGAIIGSTQYRMRYFVASQEKVRFVGKVNTYGTPEDDVKHASLLISAKQVVFQRCFVMMLLKDSKLSGCGTINATIDNVDELMRYNTPRGATLEYTQIAMGSRHCAVISKHGLLFTWGSNEYGALGFNMKDKWLNTPLASHHFEFPKQVACGVRFTAVIDKDNQLHIAGVIPRTNEEADLLAPHMFIWRHIPHPKKIMKISGAGNWLAFIDEDGDLYGPNVVPDCDHINLRFAKYDTVDVKWKDLAVGLSMLMLTVDGRLYRRYRGKELTGFIEGPWDYVRHITSSYTTSAFIDNVGRLWTLGTNVHGELGLGYKSEKDVYRSEPALVPLDKPVLRVFVGYNSMAYLM